MRPTLHRAALRKVALRAGVLASLGGGAVALAIPGVVPVSAGVVAVVAVSTAVGLAAASMRRPRARATAPRTANA
jgi:hypothetical protein